MIGRIVCVTAALTLLVSAGCEKKSDSPPAAASANPVATSAVTESTPLRDAAGKLTKAGFDAAWKSVYMGAAAATASAVEKAAAFEAKVGPPAKTEQERKIWWAFDGDLCFKVELGKDGTKGAEKVPADRCEK